MYFQRKLKIFLMNHGTKVIILLVVVGIILWAVWGMLALESFYRQLTIAQMPINLIMGGMHAIIFVSMYLYFFRGGFTKIQAGRVKSKDVRVKFEDVIGIDEAKEEAWEVVQLIKDRTRLQKIGGKILRGLLLVGPPGCGKTYLAKAIATEANIPFLSMAASEFVEVFVGVGAARIRKLFKKARQLAYAHGACIIFVDELDAVGRQRSFSFFGGGQETNTTQNQLLVEMDGLKERDYNVIIIGATNAAEGVLDEALMRPGRFDRKIYIDRPGLEGREKVFAYYLKKVKCEPNIDVGVLARKAVGKSPADIENIVKEAALIATRQNKDTVGYKEISAAIERIDMGIKHKRKMTDKERRMVAYHESGHLVVLYILHPTDDVFKASIVSRKETLGAVYHQPREEWFTSDRDRLLANIKVALGGYAAERLKCGATSDGVAADFRQAMHLAHNMVWRFDMGTSLHPGDYTTIPPDQLSENLKERLNLETNAIFQICLKEVEDLLKKEEVILDRFAKELLEKEELEYDEIERIFREYGKENIREAADYLPPGSGPT